MRAYIDMLMMVFYFFFVSVSPLVVNSGLNTNSRVPTQVHLALAGLSEDGYPTGMRVAWFTYGRIDRPVVEYGFSRATAFPHNQEGESNVYLKNFGYHHVVTITNLEPGRKYFYRCGDGRRGTFSQAFSFTTPGGASEGVKLAVIGDHGYLSSKQRDVGQLSFTATLLKLLSMASNTWDATHTRNRLMALKDEVDFVWLLGDISYADDALLHTPFKFRYEEVYNGYMTWLQPLIAYKPFQVLPGNHESECHSPYCMLNGDIRKALSNFSAYNTRFHMPYVESDSSNNMWYSFNNGLAHFCSFNTETDYAGAEEETMGDSGFIPAGGFGRDGELLKWMEADLKKADSERHIRPWLIVGGHRPLYEWVYDPADPLVTAIEDLLYKYKVDLYMSGHKHSYFRTKPVYKGVPEASYHNPTRPVYLVVGGSGNDESKLFPGGINSVEELKPIMPLTYQRVLQGWQFWQPLTPEWLAAADNHYSTGVLHVVNRTTLTFTLQASTDGSTIDQFSITKDDKHARKAKQEPVVEKPVVRTPAMGKGPVVD